MPSPHERAPDGQPASRRLHSAVCSGATPSRLAHRGACKVRRLIINLYIPASHSTADNPYSVQLRHNLEFALRIPLSERPRKFCRACGTETPWNTHDRCMVCQRKRSKEYSGRTPRFPKAVKDRLRSEHQVRCPNCLTLWKDVKLHSRHPNTPWHFDHHLSPQHGGDGSYENARIICWPCNLKKLNKRR